MSWFLVEGEILYSQLKHTFQEIEMIRNKHQENLTDDQGCDNDLEAMISFLGLQIVPTDVKCKLYKAFIVPYFRYCLAVWHFCGARNRHKFENLNKKALGIVLNERSLHLTWNH